MRLRTDDKRAQLRVAARVYALLLHHLVYSCGIAWYGVDHSRAEVGEELELASCVAGCGRHCKHAQSLRSVLESQSASEHAVARSVLEHVVRTAAHHPKAASHSVSPFVQVFLRVKYYGRIARRATR